MEMEDNMRFLKDIFEGNYPITQRFGENPQIYSRFNMKGHNGLDFGLPVGVKLLSGSESRITEMVDEGDNGFGLKFRSVASVNGRIFELTWAHLSKFEDKLSIGDIIPVNAVIGLSGNSGFCWSSVRNAPVNSEERKRGIGAHLHFQIRELDPTTLNVMYYDNGYKGALNPLYYFDL